MSLIDVDNDGEYVEDAYTCPFLPLTPDVILCFMQWYKYARKFGSVASTSAEKVWIPFFVTEKYHRFLSHCHVNLHHPSAAGVYINDYQHFTLNEVSYDTVNSKLTEFIQHVYKDSGDKIPPWLYCWRDLVIFMAVQSTDDVCRDIISIPPVVKALVMELAKRMNTRHGAERCKMTEDSEEDDSSSVEEEDDEERIDEEKIEEDIDDNFGLPREAA